MEQKPGEELSEDVTRLSASQTSLVGRLRNYFLTGLVVAGPLFITVYLTWSFITWVDAWVQPSFRRPTGRDLSAIGRSRARAWSSPSSR